MKTAALRLMVGILVFIMLIISAGCQKKSFDDGADETGKNLPPASFTLCYPVFGSAFGYTAVKGLDRVIEAVEKQIHKKLNLELKFEPISAVYFSNNVKTALHAGTIDAFIDFNGSAVYLEDFIQEGLIKDLTDIFPEYAPKLYSKFTSSDIEAVLINGRLYRVPSLSAMYTRLCFVVRSDIMDKYELPDIKTLDDFEKYLETVKEEEGSSWPLSFAPLQIPYLAQAYGYTLYIPYIVYDWHDPELKLLDWTRTPEYRQLLETIRRWRKNGYIVDITDPNYTGRPDSEIVELSRVKNGFINPLLDRVYPLNPDQYAKIGERKESIVFSNTSPVVERALMFLEWVQEKQENYDLLMHGIEGEDYVIEDGVMRNPMENNDYFYRDWTICGGQAFLNPEYMRPSNETPAVILEQYKQLVKSRFNQSAPLNGFHFNSSEELGKIYEEWREAFENFEKEYIYGESNKM